MNTVPALSICTLVAVAGCKTTHCDSETDYYRKFEELCAIHLADAPGHWRTHPVLESLSARGIAHHLGEGSVFHSLWVESKRLVEARTLCQSLETSCYIYLLAPTGAYGENGDSIR